MIFEVAQPSESARPATPTDPQRAPTITCVGRQIRLRAPAALGTAPNATCDQLVEAVLNVAHVRSVSLDYRTGIAAIAMTAAGRARDVLLDVAARLRVSPSAAPNPSLRNLLRAHAGPSVTVYLHGSCYSTWDIAALGDQELRVRRDDLASWPQTQPIHDALLRLPGITAVHWRWLSRQLQIRFDRRWTATDVLSRLDALAALPLPPTGMTDVIELEAEAAVRSVRRGLYLGLAGVSFALAIIGVAVPGLPTVPFLLATSYFLASSSPALNERLLQSRTFGPLLRDWHAHRGMRPRVKLMALAFTLAMVSVTIVFAGLSGPVLAIVLVVVATSMFVILRTPTITYSYDPLDDATLQPAAS